MEGSSGKLTLATLSLSLAPGKKGGSIIGGGGHIWGGRALPEFCGKSSFLDSSISLVDKNCYSFLTISSTGTYFCFYFFTLYVHPHSKNSGTQTVAVTHKAIIHLL